MLRKFHDDKIAAIGWPWHGRVVTLGADKTLELPGGGTMPLPNFYAAGQVTWAFDMGLPDTPDPVVEAAGGAWWGRAILRDGYFWSGLVPAGDGFYNTARQIAPLWWADDEPRRPQILDYPSFSGSTLALSWRNSVGTQAQVTRSFSNDALGQGMDQPLCAALNAAGWRLVGQSSDYFVRWGFLGAYQNRMLFGLKLIAASGASIGLPHPPATAPLSSSPAGAPDCYCGLVEVVIDKALFGPEVDPDTHIALTVLENRDQALGSPTHSLSDVTAPGGNSRARSEETEQTSALLTAWYDLDGVVRSARYSRRQVATLDYSAPTVDERHWSVTRSTNVELLYGGSVVDQRSLSERLEIDQVVETLTATRTVSESGVDDDVANWSGTYAGGSIAPDPLPVFRAGQGLVMGCVAYILTLPGQGNVLREQDVRLVWLAAHSNNVASLCRSREPYDYPDGVNTMQVEAYSGPAIGPAGVVPGSMNRVLDRPRTPVGPFYRGFFSEVGQRWVLGTGNPITGQIARANDYYGWPGGYPSISWV